MHAVCVIEPFRIFINVTIIKGLNPLTEYVCYQDLFVLASIVSVHKWVELSTVYMYIDVHYTLLVVRLMELMYSSNSVWHIGVQTVVDGVYYYWKTFKVPKSQIILNHYICNLFHNNMNGRLIYSSYHWHVYMER